MAEGRVKTTLLTKQNYTMHSRFSVGRHENMMAWDQNNFLFWKIWNMFELHLYLSHGVQLGVPAKYKPGRVNGQWFIKSFKIWASNDSHSGSRWMNVSIQNQSERFQQQNWIVHLKSSWRKILNLEGNFRENFANLA